jgi:hypothetical protein
MKYRPIICHSAARDWILDGHAALNDFGQDGKRIALIAPEIPEKPPLSERIAHAATVRLVNHLAPFVPNITSAMAVPLRAAWQFTQQRIPALEANVEQMRSEIRLGKLARAFRKHRNHYDPDSSVEIASFAITSDASFVAIREQFEKQMSMIIDQAKLHNHDSFSDGLKDDSARYARLTYKIAALVKPFIDAAKPVHVQLQDPPRIDWGPHWFTYPASRHVHAFCIFGGTSRWATEWRRLRPWPQNVVKAQPGNLVLVDRTVTHHLCYSPVMPCFTLSIAGTRHPSLPKPA